MTIGPDPMTRIDSMSSRRGTQAAPPGTPAAISASNSANR